MKYVNAVCEQNDKLLDMKASGVSGRQCPTKSIETWHIMRYNLVALSCYREPVYVSWSNSVDQAFPEAVYVGQIFWQLVLSYEAVGISA